MEEKELHCSECGAKIEDSYFKCLDKKLFNIDLFWTINYRKGQNNLPFGIVPLKIFMFKNFIESE